MPTQTTIPSPDAEAIAAELAPVVAQAQGITVYDAGSHEAAQVYLAEIARREKFVKEQFAEPKKKAHEAHRAITALEARLLEPLTAARRVVSGKLTSYEDEARRLAAAEQARLTEQARKEEEERQLLDAAAAEEAGDTQAAAEIMAEPVVPAPVVVTPAIARVEGVSTATRYRAEVEDLAALVRHVAAHPEHLNLVMANGPALNKLAVALRDAMKIPGVRVVRETDRRVRG